MITPNDPFALMAQNEAIISMSESLHEIAQELKKLNANLEKIHKQNQNKKTEDHS
ncbi:MAG: hypothetical protein AB9907_14860 [Flexilinea sp.]